jgi:hypothetical protein
MLAAARKQTIAAISPTRPPRTPKRTARKSKTMILKVVLTSLPFSWFADLDALQ